MLADGGDPGVRRELQHDFALLEACARIRPAGEVGTVPTALLRGHPRLRELLRASVATRADQCSREQCGHERRCPFGRHRRSLAKAHLVVANHDDFPSQVTGNGGHHVALARFVDDDDVEPGGTRIELLNHAGEWHDPHGHGIAALVHQASGFDAKLGRPPTRSATDPANGISPSD